MNVISPEVLSRFSTWFDQAQACTEILEPSAMALATVQPDGTPAARVVLLKGIEPEGLIFFTNYQSAKARDLDHCPEAALCFHWDPLRRQIRVQGSVTKVTQPESDRYFEERPRGSQIGAWASDQSQVLESYEILTDRVGQYEQKYSDCPVPRPEHWGGYRLKPRRIEFWESCDDRLHRRDVHFIEDGQWRTCMLYP